MTSLIRPDTIYLTGYISWEPHFVRRLNAMLREHKPNPGLVDRINQTLAECDPSERERLEGLSYPELVDEVLAQKPSAKREFISAFAGSDTKPLTIPQSVADLEAVTSFPTIEIFGRMWAFHPMSPRRHCHCALEADGVMLHFRLKDPSPNHPNFYVEIGQIPLWSCLDWKSYLSDMEAYTEEFGQHLAPLQPSRLDIAHHTQDLQPDDMKYENFLCKADMGAEVEVKQFKAKLKTAHLKDEFARLSQTPEEAINIAKLCEDLDEAHPERYTWFNQYGVQQIAWGKRGRLYCRVYNKSVEIARSTKKIAIFHSIWTAAGFDLNKPVLNLEFEIHRTYLRQRAVEIFGEAKTIDTVAELIANFDLLRSYLLGSAATSGDKMNKLNDRVGWLRMIDKSSSTRRERCAITPQWALFREGCVLLKEVSAINRDAKITQDAAKQAMPRLVRWMVEVDKVNGVYRDVESWTVEDMYDQLALLVAHSYQFGSEAKGAAPREFMDRYKQQSAKLGHVRTPAVSLVG